jgi:methionyl-tRNA synthetase
LRKAAGEVRTIWHLGNAYFAAQAPWATIRSDPQRAAVIVRTGVNLVHVSALAAWPFIPTAANAVLESIDDSPCTLWPNEGRAILTAIPGGRRISLPPLLFRKIAATDVTGSGSRRNNEAIAPF